LDECEQERLNDFTGVDSLVSPLVCLLVFVSVQFLERNGPIIEFSKDGLMAPYLKEGQVSDDDKDAVIGTEKFDDDI
jgi:hypothetical protein